MRVAERDGGEVGARRREPPAGADASGREVDRDDPAGRRVDGGAAAADHVGDVAERRRRGVRRRRRQRADAADATASAGRYAKTARLAVPSGSEPPAIDDLPPARGDRRVAHGRAAGARRPAPARRAARRRSCRASGCPCSRRRRTPCRRPRRRPGPSSAPAAARRPACCRCADRRARSRRAGGRRRRRRTGTRTSPAARRRCRAARSAGRRATVLRRRPRRGSRPTRCRRAVRPPRRMTLRPPSDANAASCSGAGSAATVCSARPERRAAAQRRQARRDRRLRAVAVDEPTRGGVAIVCEPPPAPIRQHDQPAGSERHAQHEDERTTSTATQPRRPYAARSPAQAASVPGGPSMLDRRAVADIA